MKNSLLHVIKTKGKCSFEYCHECPLSYSDRSVNLQCQIYDFNIMQRQDPKVYYNAMEMYIVTYGKDAELIEVLI